MAVKVKKGTISITTTAGADQAVDLTAAGFSASEPLRGVILWCNTRNSDSLIGANIVFSNGFISNNGGSIQQGYITGFSLDGAATSDTSRGFGSTTSCLKTFSSGAPAVDMDLRCTVFTDTGFTIDQFDAPAAAQRIHYLAIGGSDITAARVFNFATGTAVATQDITVNAGFGQPDLTFLIPFSHTGAGDSTGNMRAAFGAFNKDLTPRVELMHSQDGAGTMQLGQFHADKALVAVSATAASTITIDHEADLSAVAAWPTDGFEVTYTNQAAGGYLYLGLAIKGGANFRSKVLDGTNPTGVAPITNNYDLGANTVPKGAVMWGVNHPVNVAGDATHADMGAFVMGAYDGTSEGCAGVADEDGNTACQGTQDDSTAKVYRALIGAAGTATLASEADGAFSGTNFQAVFNDTDTVAREHSVVVFGEAAAASDQTIVGGTAIENDLAQTGTRLQPFVLTGGTAIENDVANPATVLQPFFITGGTAIENDVALTGSIIQDSSGITVVGGTAIENDAALPGAVLMPFILTGGTAVEEDAALAGTVQQMIVVGGGTAIEGDAAMPGSVTIEGALDTRMIDGFVRDIAVQWNALGMGPLVVVTEANAQAPLSFQEGYLRDARGYLVITMADGPGVSYQAGFLRTVSA